MHTFALSHQTNNPRQTDRRTLQSGLSPHFAVDSNRYFRNTIIYTLTWHQIFYAKLKILCMALILQLWQWTLLHCTTISAILPPHGMIWYLCGSQINGYRLVSLTLPIGIDCKWWWGNLRSYSIWQNDLKCQRESEFIEIKCSRWIVQYWFVFHDKKW